MTSPLYISDHALLRWLERRHGIDIEWMRRAMLAEIEGCPEVDALDHVDSDEQLHLKIDDLTFIFEDGRCITVLPPNARPMKLSRVKARRAEKAA